MENKEIVLKVFASEAKPLRPGDVAKISGVESKEVSKIIKVLKEENKIYSPKRCFYEIKND